MVICFYINTLGLGGTERVVANLANHLSKNHSVIVINSFKVKNEYILDPCVKHIYIDTNEYRTKLFRNIHRISFLRRFLKTERPNVTISFMAEPNFRLMVAKIGLKSKTIVSVRNDPTREYSGFFGKIIAKLLLVRADGCVFQTKDAKKWFSQKLQNKSTIILNPVDKVFFYHLVNLGTILYSTGNKESGESIAFLAHALLCFLTNPFEFKQILKLHTGNIP